MFLSGCLLNAILFEKRHATQATFRLLTHTIKVQRAKFKYQIKTSGLNREAMTKRHSRD
jgi:hypothetical protein